MAQIKKIKLFHRVSVKSKFLMMILGIAVACIAVIGIQGLHYGKESLTKSMHDHLTSLKSARTQQVENYFKNKRDLMKTFASQTSVIQAMGEFSAAFNLLDTYNVGILQKEKKALRDYYATSFIERLNRTSNEEFSYTTLLPKKDVVQYLQYHYIVNNPSPLGKKDLMESANDKSYYSEVHQKFHNTLKDIVKNQGFHDLFLIDPKTLHTIYAVSKGVDFATNLQDGPYAQSSLAKVVRRVVANPDKGVVKISDFKNYKAAYNYPGAFFAVPIYEHNELIGVLATQISVQSINNITTGNQNWEHDGLGTSGEVYLVGRDYKMRSNARNLIENPIQYFEDLNKTKLDSENIKMILAMKSTILNQTVNSESVKRATEGAEGTLITKNYLGKKVLSAYAPLNIEGLNWTIIAEKELDEAEKPIKKFQNALLISATILATLITFYAIWLAYTFLRPINSMINGVKNIINKSSTSTIKLNRDDEFGELSKNIDMLIRTINEQEEALKNKTKETDELLLNILPQSIATRVKNGERDIAESIPNVAVLFSLLHGFDHLSNTLEAKESIALLNELINEFDSQAQTFGIEKITTIGDSYMAASGLITPRLDYARRMSEYALSMFSVVERFNQRHKSNLELSVGIDAGEVMAGIVGEHKFIYDIWGEIVNDANRISHEAKIGTLRVSATVYEQLTNPEIYKQCQGGSELTYGTIPEKKS
jgi:class 3 adenylate cyclase